MEHGFTFGGQESGPAFSALCAQRMIMFNALQASKRYTESLSLVLKDQRSSFSQGKRSGVYCAICPPEVGHLIDICY